jgi:hypothetical protein
VFKPWLLSVLLCSNTLTVDCALTAGTQTGHARVLQGDQTCKCSGPPHADNADCLDTLVCQAFSCKPAMWSCNVVWTTDCRALQSARTICRTSFSAALVGQSGVTSAQPPSASVWCAHALDSCEHCKKTVMSCTLLSCDQDSLLYTNSSMQSRSCLDQG